LALAILLFSIQFFVSDSDAQTDISSTLNPVGSGARATGMGGAFIGIADDATAASWNPAGLIMLEKPEISAVYSYFERKQTYSSPVNLEIATENTMDAEGLNFASIVFPFELLDRNMVISLSYQRLFELNKDVTYNQNFLILGSTFVQNVIFKQDGFLYAVSPAYAVQITPELYVGATFNIWDNIMGSNGWQTTHTAVLSGVVLGVPSETITTVREDVSFEGFNSHLGFLWSIDDSWTLGGVYKTAFDADINKIRSVRLLPAAPLVDSTNYTLRMPPSYGLGLAFRHSDSLTIALDVYRTNWSRHVLRNEATAEETNPLDGRSISEGRLKDTTQIRLGTEYLFIRDKHVIPVRLGLFYDPDPAKVSPDDMYGFTLGTGYARGKMAFDIAYQFRTGNNVTGDISFVEGSSADIEQHTILFSVILYLDDMYTFLKRKNK
jgi:long-subunit fatty acid transport protein